MDAREVRPLGVSTHQRGEALRVLSAALAMAEGTACVESAGEAEKAIAAKSEALEPRAYGKARRRERPPQSGAWHGVETSPREGKQEGYVRTWGKSNRVRGTHLWRPQRDGCITIRDESGWERATRPLETAEGSRNGSDLTMARAGGHRRRNSSGHRKKATV